jgi:hypothetical protein
MSYVKKTPPLWEKRYEHKGEQHSYLTVDYTVRESYGKSNATMAYCHCRCGKEVKVLFTHIVTHIRLSCGCLQGVKHDLPYHKTNYAKKIRTRTYNIWAGMKQRCLNPKHTVYDLYGGRGVVICDTWMEYSNFLSDMGEAPLGMSIDRIDSNLGYCKDNCRWATQKTQNNNKNNNHYITINGELLTMMEASEKYNVPYYRLRSRLARGWDVTQAILLDKGAICAK